MLARTFTALAAVLIAVSPTSVAATDPYFPTMGDAGFDAQHYSIQVRMDPATGRLRGNTQITARANRELWRFRLELALKADTVEVNGVPADFWRGQGLRLVIEPASVVSNGAAMTITVSYHGRPSHADATNDFPWLVRHAEQLGVGEPRIAPWWFPVNDHPRDKATYDVVGTVPRGRQFVSNGELVSRRETGAWTRWHWRTAEPMASYATLFAAGRYRIERDGDATYAVSKTLSTSDQRANFRLLRATPEIVSWMQTQLGPYPFGQTGGLVSGTFGNENWSMETQTRPTYPDLTQVSDAQALMVHELAHQWFGDSVTPRRWRDIWLNEGFARWAEIRYEEVNGGRSANTWLRKQYRAHPAGSKFWLLDISDPGPDHLFAWAVYDRGAMAVEALRTRIGDAAFFSLLLQWTQQKRWGTATIEEFQALGERVSGQDLSGFFRTWLVDERRPARIARNGL